MTGFQKIICWVFNIKPQIKEVQRTKTVISFMARPSDNEIKRMARSSVWKWYNEFTLQEAMRDIAIENDKQKAIARVEALIWMTGRLNALVDEIETADVREQEPAVPLTLDDGIESEGG